ncbi:hypothetical protein EBR03_02230 [bacterium]|nr:hypothetical protein [bacterium]
MSNQSQELILPWGQECIDLAEQILRALGKEKKSLISFDIELLTNAVAEKQSLMHRLKERREALRRLVSIRYSKKLEELSEVLPEEHAQKWAEQQQQWKKVWGQLIVQCQSNQSFLKHSLKNMDLLLGHLKHLFGNPGIYNQTGKRQDLNSSGKVLEGRF